MLPTKTTRTDGGALRARAEARWREKGGASATENDSTERTQRLVHELQVHQIELEMQNEELQAALTDLQTSRGHYADLYDFAPVGYLTLDSGGDIQKANFAAARLLGQERSRLVGARLASFVSTESRQAFATALQQAYATQTKQVCMVAICPEQSPPLWIHVEAAVTPDGSNACQVVLIDVTLQRQAEQLLRDAQRMETVGRLAGGIAHDFNNILAVILNTAELSMEDVGEGAPVHHGLAEIHKAATRAATLTRQLLAFSRRQVLQPRVVDLNKIVGGVEGMMRGLLGENIVFSLRLTPTLGRVMADPGQVEQVLMNLALNAREAMKNGGRLTIETANVELDETTARHYDGAKTGPHVMLSVTDTGCGMDEKTLARVYEPFFTTKEIGKGTGLGLATVYGIVKQSGGAIRVESEPGKGTAFTVLFPLELSSLAPLASPAVVEKPARATETILLVEDEEIICALAKQILTRAGYTVLAASHGGEALRLCEQHKGPLHLVLTDVIMPEMSGKELADRLRALYPRLHILFMSGYTEETITEHGVLNPGTHFIGKPFSPSELTRKIRQILDHEAQAARV
jgi:PAS domain S-box-containing protein